MYKSTKSPAPDLYSVSLYDNLYNQNYENVCGSWSSSSPETREQVRVNGSLDRVARGI